jgi:MFS family permease
MLIPELPEYLTALGGAEYKGLIISLFTVTAMLSRPFSGKLADKIGRIPVMIFGVVVCLICSLIYPMLTSIYGFFLLRLAHGFSTGFTPTGQAAYLSDIIPANRRGEAMGYLGTAGTLGMASGPAIGGLLANEFGINAVFYLSSLFALISILILINTNETLKEKNKFSVSMLKVSPKDIWEPRVWMPCVVMVLTAYAYGAVFTLIPDFGEHVGIKNKGILFTYFTIASLLVRLIGGKASDYYGRVPVLRISTVLVLLSMATIAMASNQFELIFGVVFYGIAQGLTSPTLLAWATDLSDEHHKGRGIACFYIFMELGIGLGAFISGWIYGNDPLQFVTSFMVCSVLGFVSFAFLVTRPLFSTYEAR